jgi:hypothetical protein
MPRKPTGRPNGRPRKEPGSACLSPLQEAAIPVEVRIFRWGDKWGPGSAGAVARTIHVTARTVRDWRLPPHYDQALVRALAADAYATRPVSPTVGSVAQIL